VDAFDVKGAAVELAASRLFDRLWYLAANKDVAAAGMDPLDHFLRFGWSEGRGPNRYFDPAWYLVQNPDVAGAGIDPLLHYIRHGEAEGRRPMPWFDPRWYREVYRPPAEQGPLAHYLSVRDTGRFLPSAAMYAARFLSPGDGDPVARWLDTGQQKNNGTVEGPDPVVIGLSGLFDVNYYLINGSDVYEADLEAVGHYCRFGWRENRRPNAYFDSGWYVATNPDVARLGVNPLTHYILEGEALGRRPVAYFDPAWYRAAHAVPEGQSPLAHYLQNRRGQAVSPTPLFDVSWYLGHHREEIGPNRDPFAHYLLVGTRDDIDPSPRFDAGAYRRQHIGRPSRGFPQLARPEHDNPLIHHLLAEYAGAGN